MKISLRALIPWATLSLAAGPAAAQQEPIIGVDIIRVGVSSGSGAVISAALTSGGSGYTVAPTVTFAGGGGTGATATATVTNGVVTGFTLTNGGSGYTSAPTVTFSPPGTPATASATIGGAGTVIGLAVGSGGSGYTTAPTVTIEGGGGTGATATATVSGGAVTGLTLTSPGTGYTSTPTVTIAPAGTTATGRVVALGTTFDAPFQNESYGTVGTTMTFTARAYGTFLEGGYTYDFFVNGQSVGQASGIPAGLTATAPWAPPQPGAYILTVRATDGVHTAISLPVRYFATGTAMIGPVDNALVPIGSSVVMQATATPIPSAPNAFVERMEFYVDGALVGTDRTYPYSYIYTPASTPTTHTLEARGFDNNGRQISPDGSATRRVTMVTPIGTPPTVRILNPINNASVSSGTPVRILVDASSATGFIKNVDFYLNGQLLSGSQTFPFEHSWTPQVPGRYEFVAIGSDDKSNAVASTPVVVNVTGAFPTASISAPASGVIVVQGSTVPVRVSAAGADGGIASLRTIEFLVDGAVSESLPKATTGTGTGTGTPAPAVLTEPFVFDWRANVAVGTHRLAARVTDAAGLSITSQEVVVTVIANQPPQVSLTAPTAGSTVTVGTATTVSANPTDTDGTIDAVEFFVNGTAIGRATARPYQVSWTPVGSGSVDLTARATDNGGATALSSVVTVTVEPAATSGTDTGATTPAFTVYRGDYGSATEAGRFAFAVNRNNRGTFIGFSTAPTGKTYYWADVPLNADGTFTVRDANNQVVLSGQVSATGVSGSFDGKTFIGPVTASTGSFTPLLVSGALTDAPNSLAVAIVGGDGAVTIYSASGNNREAGETFLAPGGSYSFTSPTGGRLSGTVANTAGIVSGSIAGPLSGNFQLRQQASRLTNISTRSLAGAGESTLVAGFVVSGTGAKPLLVRGIGPTLANFGVAAPLADPTLTVQSPSATVATNNDWGNSAALSALFGQVGAFPLAGGSRDAAVQVSVAPGTYLAVVNGSTSTPGSALVEIYDTQAGASITSRITNISTRGQVASGNPLIAGFVITGDQRKRLLIRAVGPTLANFGIGGAVADPRLEVLAGSTVIASNNDWTDTSVAAQVAATAPVVGAFALNAGSKDAAMVVQLSPGSYTVQVAGAGAAAGVVLVEIYDADL